MGATAGSGVEVTAIDTPALGDRSYLAHDGEVALVVDPQRDIDRVLALAAARGVRITHVFETHVHNDYVTGGLALARATGAASHIAGAVHIPIHQLPSRVADIPEGEVWVHCEAGYRASVAASILDAAGRTVVAVDDEYARAAGAGLPAGGGLAHTAATLSARGGEPMCSPVVCPRCKKITWSGCGVHADQVMAAIPEEKRCTCP
jgi:hydroxyacylglutathione hydrolase